MRESESDSRRTQRREYAMTAMHGILAGGSVSWEEDAAKIAKTAFAMADAMLVREKQ